MRAVLWYALSFVALVALMYLAGALAQGRWW